MGHVEIIDVYNIQKLKREIHEYEWVPLQRNGGKGIESKRKKKTSSQSGVLKETSRHRQTSTNRKEKEKSVLKKVWGERYSKKRFLGYFLFFFGSFFFLWLFFQGVFFVR